MKTNYRDIIELLELMPEIREIISLNQLPHFTTINKFFLRIRTSMLYNTLIQTVYLFTERADVIAIDSTGYSSNYASRYYVQRMHGEQERRSYIKASLSVDTNTQCILSVKPRPGPRNDNIDFGFLVKESSRLVRIAWIVADKGYDSERNHRLVWELGGRCMIPVRRREGGKTYGSFRKKSMRRFDKRIYHRRSVVESVNSVMKRLMGSWVGSRSAENQCKEVIGMCIVYNVYRSVRAGLVWIWMFSTRPFTLI